MKTIIMAGGSGTRLWPLSRENFPKQYLKIHSDKSLIQLTAERLLSISTPSDLYVVTKEDQKLYVMDQLNIDFKNIILEPAGKNTAPAIALTIKYLLEKEKTGREELLLFCPADHIIKPDGLFTESVNESMGIAKEGSIVIFGIKPGNAETAYGYIETGEEIRKNFHYVNSFKEKPDLKKAAEYIKSGNYLWNSGLFLFSMGVMLDAFEKHCPDIFNLLQNMSYEEMIKSYNDINPISIDYAVMEKEKGIVCRTLNVEWNDVGSWESYYRILPLDENNNAVSGDFESIGTKNCMVIGENRLLALIGVSDLMVIDANDALLICGRGKGQSVKDLVGILKSENRPEINKRSRLQKLWGSTVVLEESKDYIIKKIIVKPGKKTEFHRHSQISERLVTLKGIARITIDKKDFIVNENDSIIIPVSQYYKIANPGKVPLEIIEIQNGIVSNVDDADN